LARSLPFTILTVMDDLVETRVACPRSAGDERAMGLNGWLLTEGRRFARAAELLEEFSRRLVAVGVPVSRTTVHLPQNHPQFAGYTVVWTAEDGVVVDRIVSRRDVFSIMYFNSPLALMHRTGQPVRRRLERDGEADFPILDDLASEGTTDYLMLPLSEAAGRRVPGFSLATRRPGGFTEDEAALARTITPALGAVAEIMVSRSMMRSLLGAYVGQGAARHILNGEVLVGGGRSIDAVILFADLRGFTSLSEVLPRDQILALLNGFFACVVGVVLRHGGEVLKFMGDGLLAVFPLDPEAAGAVAPGDTDPPPVSDEDELVARALMAALESHDAMETHNRERSGTALPPLEAGIALHIGSVLFGNIGTEERLDFTVIGPAVNLAARLQQLCADLGKPILMSEQFASRSPVQLHNQGRYRLRGLAELQEVYAPVVMTMD
jgi:adenylate cyclase